MAWQDLDDKLERGGVDGSKVSCTEPWELTYAVQAIRETYGVNQGVAASARDACCKEVPAPRPRADFCKCVDSKLG